MMNTLNTSREFQVKIRHDGSKFIGIQTVPSRNAGKDRSKVFIPHEEEIEAHYKACLKAGMRGLRKNIVPEVFKRMESKVSLEDVDFACVRFKKNFVNRLKTYRDKVNLIDKFNFFATITYSPRRFSSEDEFRRSLKRLWNNLAENWGWKVCGAFEKGELGERLHFHAFVFIPENGLRGEFVPERHYSTKRRKWEYRCSNTYFTERFGINEFAPLSKALQKQDCPLHYIAKYIEKTDERFFYSRGLKGTFVQPINEEEVFATYNDFIEHLLIDEDAIIVDYYKGSLKEEPLKLDFDLLIKSNPLWEKVLC